MMVVCFKQKTAYELRISDWSSDVCSSDLVHRDGADFTAGIGGFFDILRPGQIEERVQGFVVAQDRRLQGQAKTVGHGRALNAVEQRAVAGLIQDRKSVGKGTRVSVRVDLGGRRSIKKKKRNQNEYI